MNFLKKLLFRQKVAHQSVCCICGDLFDDNLMTTVDTLALCPHDTEVYKKNNWELHKELHSDPTDPDNALHIQDLKDKLTKEGTACFIKSSYFQDSDGHLITKFQLFSIKN